MAGYTFDVFVSYSRHGSVGKWLLNHFYPKLKDCLADQIAPAPTVFLDRTMRRGAAWPDEIRNALGRSKIMVAVLTPPYFVSPWCMAELSSMFAREEMLGLANPARPQGLIYPLLYSDSVNFPEEPRLHRSWWDFKELNTPEPVFQQSPQWPDFHRRVTAFATDLVELLQQVPEWQPDWPLVEPPAPVLLPPPPIPRFD
ncbi:MAG TPA: TIR domain-containing protein [Pseudonocardiaceae bacterium]|nr:TIR domain-containing protein [Pseudonocardiaceae bacterium]